MPDSPLPVSSVLVDQLERLPTHDVLTTLSVAARDAKLLASPDFKKLLAYLLELADGKAASRGRRSPAPSVRIRACARRWRRVSAPTRTSTGST